MGVLPTVNRYACIVEPKQSFLDWINSTPSKFDYEVLLEDFQKRHTSVFLIPEYDYEADGINWFKRNCKHALAELFGGWCTSPEYWPTPDWKTFNLMFVFRLDSMLFDMADEPIFREE